MSKGSKWTSFAKGLYFKGITGTNKSTLEYIASKHHTYGCELTYKQIGDAVGVTKQAARRNVRKMESLGIVKTKYQYGSGYKNSLPLLFKINLDWSE